jgi:hypothetical protein
MTYRCFTFYFEMTASASKDLCQHRELLSKFIPRVGKGSVLLTTQNEKVAHRFAKSDPIRIEAMGYGEAEKLFTNDSSGINIFDDVASKALIKLSQVFPPPGKENDNLCRLELPHATALLNY